MHPSITSEAADASSSLNSITPVEPRDHRLVIQFTGSGSEYFRIWIVNLLLVLVTLGIYYPWAKVRRLRYFYGNTVVDGAPLDFHGDPKKMLRGYALTGALVALYSVAGKFSALAGLIALLVVAALWPALLKSSMQFRLANTSWRGLRFRFAGSLRGAYRAMVPLFVPGVVLVGLLVFEADPESPSIRYAIGSGAVLLATLVAAPWLWWNLKSYQHNHYALAQLQTELRSSVGAFYGVFLRSFGVLLLAAFLIGLLIGLVGLPGGRRSAAMAIGVIVGMLAFFVVLQVVVRPYFTSRMQNLLWSRTGNSQMRFRSDLRLRPLALLTLKNWLLTLLTFGLYGPFAAIAVVRMRLQAVSITTRINPDVLLDQIRAHEGEAAGDAAGDLLGLDIGL
jgi:uncharacterized membrane protein YjgN (DUF898 family)